MALASINQKLDDIRETQQQIRRTAEQNIDFYRKEASAAPCLPLLSWERRSCVALG